MKRTWYTSSMKNSCTKTIRKEAGQTIIWQAKICSQGRILLPLHSSSPCTTQRENQFDSDQQHSSPQRCPIITSTQRTRFHARRVQVPSLQQLDQARHSEVALVALLTRVKPLMNCISRCCQYRTSAIITRRSKMLHNHLWCQRESKATSRSNTRWTTPSNCFSRRGIQT